MARHEVALQLVFQHGTAECLEALGRVGHLVFCHEDESLSLKSISNCGETAQVSLLCSNTIYDCMLNSHDKFSFLRLICR